MSQGKIAAVIVSLLHPSGGPQGIGPFIAIGIATALGHSSADAFTNFTSVEINSQAAGGPTVKYFVLNVRIQSINLRIAQIACTKGTHHSLQVFTVQSSLVAFHFLLLHAGNTNQGQISNGIAIAVLYTQLYARRIPVFVGIATVAPLRRPEPLFCKTSPHGIFIMQQIIIQKRSIRIGQVPTIPQTVKIPVQVASGVL